MKKLMMVLLAIGCAGFIGCSSGIDTADQKGALVGGVPYPGSTVVTAYPDAGYIDIDNTGFFINSLFLLDGNGFGSYSTWGWEYSGLFGRDNNTQKHKFGGSYLDGEHYGLQSGFTLSSCSSVVATSYYGGTCDQYVQDCQVPCTTTVG